MVQVIGPKSQNPSIWCGGALVGVIAAQLLTTALWSRPGGMPIAWFPSAVLLSVLLSVSPRLWPGCVLAALVGMLIMAVGLGWPVKGTLLVAFTLFLFLCGAAWLLLLLLGNTRPLDAIGRLAAFGLVAFVLLPAASAICIDYLSRFTGSRGGLPGDWFHLALAYALGYVLYLPLWISGRHADATVPQRLGVPLTFPGLELAMVALLGAVWYWLGGRVELTPLLCLAPTPIIICACIRTNAAGSSVVVFIVALVAACLTVVQKGPFVAPTPLHTTLGLQLWALTMSLSALTLAVIVEQRTTARRALAQARHDVRTMAGRLIATIEQERARLARNLHDDINPRLSASSTALSELRGRVAPGVCADISRIQDQVIALADDVQQLSQGLHPSCLVHLGLYEALDSLCQRHRCTRGPQIGLTADRKADLLAPEVALCLFRVAQEALANALHHAAARRITIRVSIVAEQAALWISDDGVGFDTVSHPVGGAGLGLISMQERTKLLGGSFYIRSAPGKGVGLCIRIPLVVR